MNFKLLLYYYYCYCYCYGQEGTYSYPYIHQCPVNIVMFYNVAAVVSFISSYYKTVLRVCLLFALTSYKQKSSQDISGTF